jgi:hypothetical protein
MPAILVANALVVNALLAGAAQAEVRVQGNAAALEVDAKHAPVAEVLSALAGLNVRFRSSIALDRTIDGVYAGDLGTVLPRLLSGYDFIVVRKDGAAEVVILGNRTGAAIAAPGAAPGPTATGATNRHVSHR